MSDLETLKAILDRAGIVYTSGKHMVRFGDDEVRELVVEKGDGPKNDGYPGFCTMFFFDENGALVRMGAWE